MCFFDVFRMGLRRRQLRIYRQATGLGGVEKLVAAGVLARQDGEKRFIQALFQPEFFLKSFALGHVRRKFKPLIPRVDLKKHLHPQPPTFGIQPKFHGGLHLLQRSQAHGQGSWFVACIGTRRKALQLLETRKEQNDTTCRGVCDAMMHISTKGRLPAISMVGSDAFIQRRVSMTNLNLYINLSTTRDVPKRGYCSRDCSRHCCSPSEKPPGPQADTSISMGLIESQHTRFHLTTVHPPRSIMIQRARAHS